MLKIVLKFHQGHLQQGSKCRWGKWKLSYCLGTVWCVMSVEILPVATQQCRNCLYDKSWRNRSYEVGGLQWQIILVLKFNKLIGSQWKARVEQAWQAQFLTWLINWYTPCLLSVCTNYISFLCTSAKKVISNTKTPVKHFHRSNIKNVLQNN